MAKDLGNEQLHRWRRRAIATWAAIAALVVIAFIVMFVMAATDPTENPSRSAATKCYRRLRASAPGAARSGTTRTASTRTSIRWFCSSTRTASPVAQARGGADRLDPGETFQLQATLPAEAVRMQIYQMRWTTNGRHRAVLGPYRSWPFGYVMDSECDALRLKIGSCVPQRERT